MSMISKFYESYLLTEDTNNPKQSALNSFLSSHMSDRNDIIEADGLLSAALDYFASTVTIFRDYRGRVHLFCKRQIKRWNCNGRKK